MSSTDPSGGGLTLGVQDSITQGRTTTTTTVTTAEGRVNTYAGQSDGAGTFTSTITEQNGTQNLFSLSPDGFSSQRIQANGMILRAQKLPDPLTGASYTAATTITTPTGLEKTTSVVRTYGSDGNADGLPDTITTIGSVNGQPTTEIQDIQAHTIALTTPESRTAIRTYDPDTLKITAINVPRLETVLVARDAQGRIEQRQPGRPPNRLSL